MDKLAIGDTSVKIRRLGVVDYLTTWQAMKNFTSERTAITQDEMWSLQHPPIYTQGLAGKPEHLLQSNGIEVIKTDRGDK